MTSFAYSDYLFWACVGRAVGNKDGGVLMFRGQAGCHSLHCHSSCVSLSGPGMLSFMVAALCTLILTAPWDTRLLSLLSTSRPLSLGHFMGISVASGAQPLEGPQCSTAGKSSSSKGWPQCGGEGGGGTSVRLKHFPAKAGGKPGLFNPQLTPGKQTHKPSNVLGQPWL